MWLVAFIHALFSAWPTALAYLSGIAAAIAATLKPICGYLPPTHPIFRPFWCGFCCMLQVTAVSRPISVRHFARSAAR